MKKETYFNTKGKSFKITIQDILTAMSDFDLQGRKNMVGWLANKNHLYAIQHQGKLYPPKRILSKITGIHYNGNGIHGGPPTNHVFEDLGFTIKKIKEK